ncbi:hypothetical protein F5B20DRAFT_524506 [Whalleya microplaca]|nr:hypothetical protein F5B20DRAFT_524506 [Whalleya microplaca]
MASLQRLPDDILWYMARYFMLDSPRTIWALSCTCQRMSDLLRSLVYKADVLAAKRGKHRSRPRYKAILPWAARVGDVDTTRRCLEAASKSWPGYITMVNAGSVYFTSTENSDFSTRYVSRGEFPVIAGVTLRRDFCTERRHICNSWESFTHNTLTIAIAFRHQAIAELLAPKGVWPLRSVYLAALAGMKSVVQILLDNQSHLNPRILKDTLAYTGGFSVLHFAAANKVNKELLEILLQHGELDADIEDIEGRKALNWAIAHGCIANACFLVDKTDLTPADPSTIESLAMAPIHDGFLPVTRAVLDSLCQLDTKIEATGQIFA